MPNYKKVIKDWYLKNYKIKLKRSTLNKIIKLSVKFGPEIFKVAYDISVKANLD